MRLVFLTAGGVILGLTFQAAQSPPNFSGHWVAVAPASVAGHELRITEDTQTLTIEQSRIQSRQTFDSFGRRSGEGAEATERTEYRLDGKETVSTVHGSGEPQQVRSSARWNKDRLVLSDVYPATHMRFERAISFDPQGRLVFETRRPPSGNEPASASASVLEPVKVVYEKR
jgi:hypothetical protein